MWHLERDAILKAQGLVHVPLLQLCGGHHAFGTTDWLGKHGSGFFHLHHDA